MLFILILAIGFYFYKTGDLQRWMNRIQGDQNGTSSKGAKDILDLRLAKGEISVDEYQSLKNIL